MRHLTRDEFNQASDIRATQGDLAAQKYILETMSQPSPTDELKTALLKAIEPIVLPILNWIDRQLRRSPRLYRWLSK